MREVIIFPGGIMKKILFLFLFILPITTLISNDLEQQVETSKALDNPKGKHPEGNRDVPYHEFIIDPINLGYSRYDYMPGSYNAIPLISNLRFPLQMVMKQEMFIWFIIQKYLVVRIEE